jgi:hypothetical protein
LVLRDDHDTVASSPRLKPWNVAATPVGVTPVGPVAAEFQTVDRWFWAGNDVVIWGIHGSPGDNNVTGYRGASLDPASGIWTDWPDWPLPDPLYGAATVWTGHELVVVGTACNAAPPPRDDEGEYIPDCSPGTVVAAGFDPATAKWRILPPAPIPSTSNPGYTAVGWSGTLAVFSVGVAPDEQLLGLDPTTATWSQLPPRPVPSSHMGCQLDDGVLAVGDLTGTDPLTIQASVLLDRTWRPLPTLTTPPTFSGVTMICGGTNVFAVFGDWTRAWQWDRTADAWIEMAGAPQDLTAFLAPNPPPAPVVHIGWTGTRFVWSAAPASIDPNAATPGRAGGAITFDPTNGQWSAGAPGPDELQLVQTSGGLNFSNWRNGIEIALTTPRGTDPLRLVAYRPS